MLFFPGAECVHVGGASHGGRLFRENVRGHLRFLVKHRGDALRRAGAAAAARRAPAARAPLPRRARPDVPRGGRLARRPARCRSCSSDDARPARARRPSSLLAARLLLVARALGLRSVAATLAWSLALIFGALAVTFARRLVADADARAAARRQRSPRPAFARGAPRPERVPGRLLGLRSPAPCSGSLLWHVAGEIGGDGLFHLARVRKLDAFDSLSLDARQRVRGRRPPPRLRVPALARLPRARRAGRASSIRRDVVLHEAVRARAGRAARRLRGGLGALPAASARRWRSSAARSP